MSTNFFYLNPSLTSAFNIAQEKLLVKNMAEVREALKTQDVGKAAKAYRAVRRDLSKEEYAGFLQQALATDNVALFRVFEPEDPNYRFSWTRKSAGGKTKIHSESSMLYKAVKNKRRNIVAHLLERKGIDPLQSGFVVKKESYGFLNLGTRTLLRKEHLSCPTLSERNGMNEFTLLLRQKAKAAAEMRSMMSQALFMNIS